ncbi:MAG: ABC transporter substrate-binding protein [Acidimicrobiales bacterium]|nr:ABC transporter substrate-binding protein [Acidimicrobiales bacterium]
MKRHTWSRPLALALALALTAAACGGDDDDSAETDDSGTSAETGGELATVPGFDGTTIKLGVITPTSGPVALIGEPLTAGNKAYFDYVNTELGGIDGKYKIELDIRDSGYDPTKAGQEYASVKENTVMIAQLLGTPIVNAILEQLIDDEVVAAPASLDSFWVREPNLLPIGGPYQIQAINALNWYVTEGEGEGKKVCSLIQDDPYGEAGQAGLDFAAEELEIQLGVTARFPVGATADAFTAPIGQLQGDGCEMVFLVSTPSATGAALGEAVKAQFAPQWIGQSPSWIGALGASPLAPYLQANFLVASEGVEYGDTSVEGMAELVRIKDTYAASQQPDVYFNFGYLQAKAVTALLEKAVELSDLSHEGVLRALEELETLTFDGLSGDYTYGPADERVPPTKSTIFKVDPANPTGLSLLERDIEAPFAKDFEFTRVDE